MAKATKPIEELTYEQALGELEDLLSSLEGESLKLEETMDLFERGRALIQRCQTLLDQAELKVRTLEEETEIIEAEERDEDAG
jgi:exodeoxyribonuclease VII small subunit